jgi:hypothetical protein
VIPESPIDACSDGSDTALANSLGEVPNATGRCNDEVVDGLDEGIDPQTTEYEVPKLLLIQFC